MPDQLVLVPVELLDRREVEDILIDGATVWYHDSGGWPRWPTGSGGRGA